MGSTAGTLSLASADFGRDSSAAKATGAQQGAHDVHGFFVTGSALASSPSADEPKLGSTATAFALLTWP